MKECVYGWYPPGRDVWKARRADSYSKDFLYQHTNSLCSDRSPLKAVRLTTNPAAETTTTSENVVLTKSAAISAVDSCHCPQDDQENCRKPSSPSPAAVETCSRSPVDVESAEVGHHQDAPAYCTSASVGHCHQSRGARERTRTSRKMWADRLPETTCTVYPSSSTLLTNHHHNPQPSVMHQQSQAQDNVFRKSASAVKPETTLGAALTASEPTEMKTAVRSPSPACEPNSAQHNQHCARIFEAINRPAAADVEDADRSNSTTAARVAASLRRVQSARPTLDRAQSAGSEATTTTTRVQRNVQSAAPHRHDQIAVCDRTELVYGAADSRADCGSRMAVRRRFQHRPRAPVPPSPVQVTLGVDEPLDYEEMLKKHGWKMEIPGDPFKLKRQCVAKRRPNSVTCAIPVVAPLAARHHAGSAETFFYATQPHPPPACFTVSPDWASELLVSRRIELQKRLGSARPPYRYTDFSFVY